MTTLVRIGPTDHGRPMTLEEFNAAEGAEGHQYELIDGKVYVSPEANFQSGILERWINLKLQLYALAHPEVINLVWTKTRVFVPNRPGATVPEPDAAAYHNFPLDMDFREVRWQDFSPILVAEVVPEDDPDKDLKRNVELYFAVPSIKEYWVVDGRGDPNLPRMTAHVRHGKRWRPKQMEPNDVYSTRLLPGFELIVNPRS